MILQISFCIFARMRLTSTMQTGRAVWVMCCADGTDELAKDEVKAKETDGRGSVRSRGG